jgi:hypothetical protein
MKKIANVTSLLAIAASLAAVIWLYLPVRSNNARQFAVNTDRVVRFRSDPEFLERFSDVELEDQLRDWLLYSVLEESGLDVEALRKSMYDVPPERAGYMKPIAAFDFGPVRFRVIDSAGSTIALIPEGGTDRRDFLAQVADSVRSRLGSKPGVIEVFEYNIDPVELSGRVTRKPDVPGDELFTGAYGYVQTEVRSRPELEKFVAQTEDVVWASAAQGGVELGGRKIGRRGTRKLRLEDIAALWQSERQLALDRQKVEAFQAKWNSQDTIRSFIEPIFEREKAELLQKYPEGETNSPPLYDGVVPRRSGRRSLYGIDPYSSSPAVDELMKKYASQGLADLSELSHDSSAALPPLDGQGSDAGALRLRRRQAAPELGAVNPDREQAIRELNARWQNKEFVDKQIERVVRPEYERQFAELKKTLSSKGGKGIPEGSGFSLDPSYDYGKLAELFERLHPLFAKLAPSADLTSIESQIRKGEEGPFLDLLYNVQKGGAEGAFLTEIVQSLLQSARFQHARYDGNLKGTEVGMVLFYTDLLAKLWALDYLESAPDKQVRGFVPLLKVSVSPIYERELKELSGTRLWFGPRESAYAKTSNALFFSRIATRVYAASSNTLQPGKEAEANAASAEFLGWWNDHYGQVAEFEPEYQRLNEIMKWSVILGWLSSKDSLGPLDFLANVRVERGNWFPQWAEGNRQLRFRHWDRVKFFAPNYQGVETESMPILTSLPFGRGGASHVLSGGVSLGSRTKILNRAELSADIEPLLRRANVSELGGSAKGSGIRTLDNTSYDFRPLKLGTPASVEAKAVTKLRGEDIELKPASFELNFDRRRGGLEVQVAANGKRVGELSIQPRSGRQIDVFFAPLEVEYARSYSKTLSQAASHGETPLAALGGRPDVKTVVGYGDSFYVEPRKPNSGWLKISRESKASANIADGADLRFASLGSSSDSSPRWNVAFLDRQRVEAELPKDEGYLIGEAPPSPAHGVAFRVMNKGPPRPPPGPGATDLASLPPNKRSIFAAIEDGRAGKGGGNGAKGGGPESGFASFGSGEGSEAMARKAALDPEGTLLLLRENRRASLAKCDRLIKEGKFEQARRELDKLDEFFPTDPNVRVRRVIALAASNSRTAAAESSRFQIGKQQIPALLESADAAWPHLAEDAHARAKVSAIVRGKIAESEGKSVHYIDTANGLGIEVRLAGLRSEAGVANESSRGAVRYSLETLDTNAPSTMTPPPPVSEPLKIRDLPVAVLQPEAIVDTRTGARYRPVGTANGSAAPSRGQALPSLYYRTLDTCSSLSAEEQKRREECRGDIYLEPRSDGASTLVSTVRAANGPRNR